MFFDVLQTKNKQTLWLLVLKRAIPTERSLLVGEFYYQLFRREGCRVVSAAVPHGN
jgi:hypothetical protein